MEPLFESPFEWFDVWMNEASETGMEDPNAMCLTTVGADGMPSSRMVLLKERTETGFVFYTNLQSRKGRELAHGKAALLFYWRVLGRQIRIEGEIKAVEAAAADAYFSTRPRLSQIGAWASKQSSVLDSKSVLRDRILEFEQQFDGQDVPRPPHWSGSEVVASSIEFWQAGEFRLHDRFVFSKKPDGWSTPVRLYP